jgi:hypothetical protein
MMPDIFETIKPLGNGKDELFIPVWARGGLGNTNPIATLAPTLASTAVSIKGLTVAESGELIRSLGPQQQTVVRNVLSNVEALGGVADLQIRFGGSVMIIEAKAQQPTRASVKPAGQVVLFRKIMDDWSFNDQEAATLLGFEAASDMDEIYTGMKSVRHRDANDRLRAVLRIGADLDALFQEVPAIRDWLNEPQRDLDGSTPRSLLTEGSMENLLRVRHYVAHLSGR